MSINYPALQAELLLSHPVSGAYDVDNQLAADQLNVEDIVKDQEFVSAPIIFDAILNNKTEWEGMSALDQQWVRDILNINSVDGVPTASGTPARTQLIDTLGPLTQAEIGAAIPHSVSRVSEISDTLGYSGIITDSHVNTARNL